MSTGDDGTKDIQGDGEAVLRDAAARLRELLAELAHNLRPFPALLNMASVQAVELEPPFAPTADHGCVVVPPEGEICEMDLSGIPGSKESWTLTKLSDSLSWNCPTRSTSSTRPRPYGC